MSQDQPPTKSFNSQFLEWLHLGLVLLGLLLVAAKQDLSWLWAFALGAFLNLLNLRLWSLLVAGLTGQKKISKAVLALLVFVKLGLLFGGLVLALLVLQAPLMPFLLGMSTLVAAIVLQGLWGVIKGD